MHGTTDKGRILLLGDARQVHIHRWQRYLTSTGYGVKTVSLESTDGVDGDTNRIVIPNVLPGALRYPLAVPWVKRIIRRYERAQRYRESLFGINDISPYKRRTDAGRL